MKIQNCNRCGRRPLLKMKTVWQDTADGTGSYHRYQMHHQCADHGEYTANVRISISHVTRLGVISAWNQVMP